MVISLDICLNFGNAVLSNLQTKKQDGHESAVILYLHTVSTSDLLYFLRHRLTKEVLLMITHQATYSPH